MAIEFSIRMERAITLSALVAAASSAFALLTGTSSPELLVELQTSAGRYEDDSTGGELDRERGPHTWSTRDDLDAIVRAAGINGVCHLGMAAYVPLGEDKESGP